MLMMLMTVMMMLMRRLEGYPCTGFSHTPHDPLASGDSLESSEEHSGSSPVPSGMLARTDRNCDTLRANNEW